MNRIKWLELSIVVILILLVSFCFASWDNDKPGDNQTWNTAAGSIRDNWDALEVELGVDLAEAHPYFQASAPAYKPDGSTALDVDDNGRIWIDSDDNNIYVLTDYSVPTWTALSALAANVTSTDAAFTLRNTDEEDSDGGRQSRWINKGEQTGGEITTLGYIEFSHDGTNDDEKGQVVIKLNDGDDTNAPSKQAIGFISTGKIAVSSSLSVLDEDDMASDDAQVLATQQSIKAYADALGGSGVGFIKGWANVKGSDGSDNGSYNVSATARSSAGVFVITWDTDFANTNYAVVATQFHATILQNLRISAKATGSVTITVNNKSSGAAEDPTELCVMAIGTQ